MEGVLVSVAIEQQREIQDHQEELESVKEEVGVIAGRIESLEHEPVGLEHRKTGFGVTFLGGLPSLAWTPSVLLNFPSSGWVW